MREAFLLTGPQPTHPFWKAFIPIGYVRQNACLPLLVVNSAVFVKLDGAEHLNSDDGIDEEEKEYQKHYVGKGLDRLHESPKQNPDRLKLSE